MAQSDCFKRGLFAKKMSCFLCGHGIFGHKRDDFVRKYNALARLRFGLVAVPGRQVPVVQQCGRSPAKIRARHASGVEVFVQGLDCWQSD